MAGKVCVDNGLPMHWCMCRNEFTGDAEELAHSDELELQKFGQLWAQLHNTEEGGDDVVRAVPDVTDLLQATHTTSCQTLDVTAA